jgi:hypothetical protein
LRRLIDFTFVIIVVIISTLIAGCSTKQTAALPDGLERSCIQGRVYYRIPADSAPATTTTPFPSVAVSAWNHEKNQPLTETKTDQAGNYCIEVPLADFHIDLRVWGMVNLPATSFTCTGSAVNIDPGSAPNRCGENCQEIEIMTDCKKFTPRGK